MKKANLPLLASFMLAIVAGGGVGFGALSYTSVASAATLSLATERQRILTSHLSPSYRI